MKNEIKDISNLEPAEVSTLISALSAYIGNRRVEVEQSPFPATVEYARKEWLTAVNILTKLSEEECS